MTEPTLESLQAQLTAALDSISKLEAKNSDLITREKNAKKAADDAQAAADAAAQEAAVKAGDVESVRSSLEKKHQNELKKIQLERDNANSQLTTLLIDNQITKSLSEGNVPAHFHDVLSAKLKAETSLEDGRAVREGVDLADSVKTYLASPAGKHFVTATQNSGGNATGSTVVSGDFGDLATWGRDEWTRFSALQEQNLAAANAVADKLNAPSLKK